MLIYNILSNNRVLFFLTSSEIITDFLLTSSWGTIQENLFEFVLQREVLFSIATVIENQMCPFFNLPMESPESLPIYLFICHCLKLVF